MKGKPFKKEGKLLYTNGLPFKKKTNEGPGHQNGKETRPAHQKLWAIERPAHQKERNTKGQPFEREGEGRAGRQKGRRLACPSHRKANGFKYEQR